uniref:Uncharacterized protein n=1 Tax=Aegilops tauschii subsp. strangulata TaxID=200361 RepID=A0A453E336_AEGTS
MDCLAVLSVLDGMMFFTAVKGGLRLWSLLMCHPQFIVMFLHGRCTINCTYVLMSDLWLCGSLHMRRRTSLWSRQHFLFANK